MHIDYKPLFKYLILIYLFIKLAFLVEYTHSSSYVMDEFSQLYKTLHINELYNDYIPIKNVLYIYYYNIAQLFGSDAVSTVLIARWQSLILSFGIIVLVYKINFRLSKNLILSILSICILLSFSTYMERSFRIRSDLLCVFLAILAIYIYLIDNKKNNSIKTFLSGLILGCSFLATQKAAYFIIAFVLSIILSGSMTYESIKQQIKNTMVLLSGTIISVFIYCLWFDATDPVRILQIMFFGPIDIATSPPEYYINLSSYILQTLNRNNLGYGLCMAAILIAIANFSSQTKNERFILIFCICMAILVFNHNQPWPYVFLMVIPLLTCLIFEFKNVLPTEKHTVVFTTLTIFTLLLTLPRNIEYLRKWNTEQLAIIKRTESMLTESETYSDGIGMIVTRKKSAPQIGMDRMTITRMNAQISSGNYSSINEIFNDNPKLWIGNYRTKSLPRPIKNMINESYINIGNNIKIAGSCFYTNSKKVFINRWKGTYNIYSHTGTPINTNIIVNNENQQQPLRLNTGKHTLYSSNKNDTEICLLPANINYNNIYINKHPSKIFVEPYK